MQPANDQFDVVIIGGGVIGLSLAWELAQHDAKVCLLDRGPLGQEASWAGAGMIPAGPAESNWQTATAYEQLEGLSQRLHAEWYERLLDLTGIDNEYRRCGALQLALTADEAQSLEKKAARWKQLGIAHEQLDASAIRELEPALADQASTPTLAYHLPGEAQIRNPRHLRALIEACRISGVDLRPNVEVQQFQTTNGRLTHAISNNGTFAADKFCLATGSWTGQLANSLGIDLPVRPIRGQIALLQGPPKLIQRNINVGPRYLVSRTDGRILIGSTQEDVGFEKETTQQGIADLRKFTAQLAPATTDFPLETSWSGLRPGTADGLPILGQVPQLKNTWLATGHFRAGLQLSPATAVVMRSIILGQSSLIDVTAVSAN